MRRQSASAHLIREHWHVENKLHWTLDVTFHEDHARTAKARGTHAMAILRRVALGMIRAVPSEHPMSIAMKKRITNWRFDYMLQALSSGFVADSVAPAVGERRALPLFP
jgi:hypothetical protein